MCGQDAAITCRARLLLCLEHDGTGAVPKQHASAAVVPVEDARERLRTEPQCALVGAATQKIVRGSERKNEAGTDRLEVERCAVMNAEPVLDRDRGGWK